MGIQGAARVLFKVVDMLRWYISHIPNMHLFLEKDLTIEQQAGTLHVRTYLG